jgi:regulator of sirC expression with transglutaminase-like and TPR domain
VHPPDTVAPVDAVDRFAALVQAPEEALSLDVAAVCISAALRAGVDVDGTCRRLDDLANACAASTFASVREQLFTVQGFRGDTDDYADPRNSFLDAVLDRRRGLPITLSVLFIEVARRRGVTVHGVGMPGHFLVQDAGDRTHWCDPFNGGVVLTRDDCAQLFLVAHGGARPLEDADLAAASPRAILARMLANLEHGPLAADAHHGATLCALHLAIPGVPLEQQVLLLRGLARGAAPERVERAYADVAAGAPDEIASQLHAEARAFRARWN